MTSLYRLLLRLYYSGVVVRSLELHAELIPSRHRQLPSCAFLYAVLSVNSLVLDLEQFHHQELLPRLAGASINEPTRCTALKNKLLLALEHRISEGLQRVLHLMVEHAESILSALQYRKDFKDALLGAPTPACNDTCAFLSRQLSLVHSCLDGANADLFLRGLGTQFYAVLLRHLSRFTISTGTGGSQLMIDLARYCETIHSFQVGALDTQFAQLRQMANIHLVAEKQVMSLVKELISTGANPKDLKQFLPTHEHYQSSWVELL